MPTENKPPEPKKRGRPTSATAIWSAAVNYEALAWQTKQRIDEASKNGEKKKIRDAVKEIMLESLNSNTRDGRPMHQGHMRDALETSYTEVRKILKKWGKKKKM
jgi:hypothetical protein